MNVSKWVKPSQRNTHHFKFDQFQYPSPPSYICSSSNAKVLSTPHSLEIHQKFRSSLVYTDREVDSFDRLRSKFWFAFLNRVFPFTCWISKTQDEIFTNNSHSERHDYRIHTKWRQNSYLSGKRILHWTPKLINFMYPHLFPIASHYYIKCQAPIYSSLSTAPVTHFKIHLHIYTDGQAFHLR